MTSSDDELRRSLGRLLATKEDVPEEYPGLLGTYIAGTKTIDVPGRPNFVYVRIRGSQSEIVQAFNETVSSHYDLPIVVRKDRSLPNYYRVVGRDVNMYSSWGGQSYIANHGAQHSFGGGSTPGADITWVYKRQFMPLMLRPYLATGSMRAYVESDYYGWGTDIQYHSGSSTTDFTPAVPSSSLSRFMTVYLDGSDDSLKYLSGTTWTSASPPADLLAEIPIPTSAQGIPLGAVLLYGGMTQITWTELFDLRLIISGLAGASFTVAMHDLDPASGFHTGTLPATDVSIVDAGGYFVGTEVETALQELGAAGGGGSSPHIHGVTRWDGISGSTSLALPDTVEYIDYLTNAGLTVDPGEYTLSLDGNTINLASPLSASAVLSSGYVIRTV